MIFIYQPKITDHDGKSCLTAQIDVDGELSQLLFEVDTKYGKYLCDERSDAFVIGALQWAMRAGHDITCAAPVTQELLYNLHEHLIPILHKYSKTFHPTRIYAHAAPEPIEKCDIEGVGTGMSCGVDSFHAALNHYQNQDEKPNLTHLCINNTGSFHFNPIAQTAGSAEKAKEAVYSKAREVANLLNLPLIESDSNIIDVFPIYIEAHTYTSIFAVLCMQKLWKTYFFASSKDYSHFTLTEHEHNDSSFYDLLSLNCFSTRGLRIYSEGSAVSRLEKLAFIADNSIAQKYLHCCYVKTTNCLTCFKCRRTILMLDSLHKLDDFSECFSIEYFRDNMGDYLEWLQSAYDDENAHALALYPTVKNGKYVSEYLRSLGRDEEAESRKGEHADQINRKSLMVVLMTRVRNGEKTLARTIESVLSQTHDCFVYYIVDNGSTDSTPEIIKDFTKRDPRVKYLSQTAPLSLKFFDLVFNAIEEDYDYLADIDADDEYDPDFLEKMLCFAQKHDLDIACAGYREINTENNAEQKLVLQDNLLLTDGKAFNDCFSTYRWFAAYLWGKIYRKSVINAMDLKSHPHYDLIQVSAGLISSLLWKSKGASRVGILAQTLHTYYRYPDSGTNQLSVNRTLHPTMLFEAWHSFLIEKCGEVSLKNMDHLYVFYNNHLALGINNVINAKCDFGTKLESMIAFIDTKYTYELAKHPGNEEGKKGNFLAVGEWLRAENVFDYRYKAGIKRLVDAVKELMGLIIESSRV